MVRQRVGSETVTFETRDCEGLVIAVAQVRRVAAEQRSVRSLPLSSKQESPERRPGLVLLSDSRRIIQAAARCCFHRSRGSLEVRYHGARDFRYRTTASHDIVAMMTAREPRRVPACARSHSASSKGRRVLGAAVVETVDPD